jgi:RHS repeat-associated protein
MPMSGTVKEKTMHRVKFIVFMTIAAFTAAPAMAQAQAPVCDVTCTPNINNSSYGGAAAARSKILNARGSRSPIVATTGPAKVPRTQTVIGSQSYNYVIPILSIPGRTGMDLNLNLYYNSRVWDVDSVHNTVTFNADRDFPSYGFRLDYGYIENASGYIVTESDGSKHALAVNTSSSALYDSTDGTYMELNTVNMALTFKNGTIMYYEPFPSQAGQQHPTLFRPTQIRDTNGNYLYFGYLSGHDEFLQTISDTGNRFISFNYDGSGKLTTITQVINGVLHTYATFTWGTKYGDGSHWYSFSGLTPVAPDYNTPLNIITQCTYANGTGYRFTYGDWGIITKIENLSASGTPRSYVSYNYPLANAGALTDAPSYTQQTISPDGLDTNTSVWNYSVTKQGTGVVTSMSVKDPLAVINDPSGSISVSTLDPNTGLLTQVQVTNPSSVPLRTVGYAWTTSGPGTVPSQITTVLNDTGQSSFVQYGYDPYNGDVTDLYEYDFGNVLKRHAVTTYQDNFAYHIFGLATRIVVQDGAGNTISRTDMAYDGGSLTPITGAANHDDPGHGAGFTTRGNLTSITRYSNAAAGTGGITRNFTYDTLGNLLTAQLDCCTSKTFNFSSATQYDYPDSVVRGPSSGPQFTTSYTYDNGSGRLLTSTDENGQVTQYQYDSMSRSVATLLPPQNGTVVQMNTSYGDTSTSPTVTSYTTNSGNTAQTVTTFDGLGHVMQVDNTDGTNVLSTTKSTYDKLWRRIQASNPYAPGETPVYTQFAYDGLNRVTRVTPPSAGYTQYSYSGNTVTVTDPAGKQRRNYSDALGRLIEVDEPGWGDAAKSRGTVMINGNEQSICTFFFHGTCRSYIYDTGTISITVNGATKSTTYNSGSSASSIASDLASAINRDSTFPVTAGVSGALITLTSVQAGANTNYALSGASATNDSADFGGPSFAPSFPQGPNLSSGLDGTPEGSPTLARPIVTTYAYSALDQLTSASVAAMGPVNGVTYSGQPRSYAYDSLGRITSVTTPESGTVTNYYTDANNQPCANDPTLACRVVDARNITKTLTYDGIGRPLTVTYSDGITPNVSYAYDNGGAAAFALTRLTSITEGGNSQTFTYDNLGRIKSVKQTIDAVDYLTQYAYNLLGQLSSITYPSTHVVTQTYDNLGRMASIANGSNIYLSGLSYNAAGETLGLTMGNGVQGAFTYNDHLQLATLRYFKTGLSPDPLNLSYDYTSAAQPNNNGQIQAMHYYTQPGVEDQTKSEQFTYDSWFRLKAAQTITVDANTPGTWSLQWAYDRLGNRLSQTLTGGNLPGGIGQPTFTIDQNTNRITGITYDNGGNLTNDGIFTYTYDGANRMTQAQQIASPNTTTTSTYFGSLRIKKAVGSTPTLYIYSGNKPIAEYSNGSLSKEYIYAGSTLLVTIAGTTTTYHHPDHLSNRAETDTTGTPVRSFGHFPYGEVWYETGTADKWKFTSYERDSAAGETGLDYALARLYSPGLARFMSADSLGGHPSIPQSLNRYAYVQNYPHGADPTGLECVWDDGSYDSEDDADTGSVGQCQSLGGTWIELGAAFGDWNPMANSTLSSFIDGLRSGLYDIVWVMGRDGQNWITKYDSEGRVDWSAGDGMVKFYTYVGHDRDTAGIGGGPSEVMMDPSGNVANGFAMWIQAHPGVPLDLDQRNEMQFLQQMANFGGVDPNMSFDNRMCQFFSIELDALGLLAFAPEEGVSLTVHTIVSTTGKATAVAGIVTTGACLAN